MRAERATTMLHTRVHSRLDCVRKLSTRAGGDRRLVAGTTGLGCMKVHTELRVQHAGDPYSSCAVLKIER